MTLTYDEKKAHYLTITFIPYRIDNGVLQYFIAKRDNNPPFPNKWTVPGGKLEVDDYASRSKDTPDCWYNVFEFAGVREVKEETNLDIDLSGLEYVVSMAFFREGKVPSLIVSLAAPVTNPDEVKLSDELVDYAWVTLGEAKGYDLIDGIYGELEILEAKLNGGKKVWGK